MPTETKVKIKGQTLTLTNLDKVFWPREGYTKGDVIDYYQKIAPYILPYLKNRPENLNRHPNGIKGKNFFQKDVDHIPPPWVKTVKIYSESNKKFLNYMTIQDKASLIYAVNLGCIEINPWNSRVKNLDRPDFLIFDLDPEGISFDHVVEAAQAIHKLLEKAGVKSFPKTSGATGLHIYVPLSAKYTYQQAKQFTHTIVQLVNQKLPKTTSLKRHPAKRRHKVYLDYLQNNKGQTLAAPYSLRPKEGATVATPLKWSEVKKGLDPKKFTIKTIFARLKKHGDLFRPVLGKGADLKKALKRLSA